MCGALSFTVNFVVFMQIEAGPAAVTPNYEPGVTYVGAANSEGARCLYTDSGPTGRPVVAGESSGSSQARGPGDSAIPRPTPSDVTTPEATVDPTTEERSDACFPAHATVELECGVRVRMDALQIGDRVKVGAGQFSEVFMFTHRLHSDVYQFVSLQISVPSFDDVQLQLSAGHYLPVNGVLKAAAAVVLGDTVVLGDGSVGAVTGIAALRSRGLFNPQTLDGKIVVDGVVASTYTTAVKPAAAHTLLLPMRQMFRASGALMDPSFGLLENGFKGFTRFWVGVVSVLEQFS